MKTLQKILLIVLFLAVLIGGMFYDAYYVAPTRYNVRYETLSSTIIPKQLDDLTILFFTDLDYGRFMNEERLNKLIDKMNSLSPDMIIFGGDVFDQDAPSPSQVAIDTVTKAFKSLHAPLGKFAVLGDFDHLSSNMEKTVSDLYYNADFELLNNQSALIRNSGSQSITLIGLDSEYKGKLDVAKAYSNVPPTNYTITVCHTPDTADKVPDDITNYFLAGHSHGGQVNLGFKVLYTPPKATKYLAKKHRIHEAFTLDISNGVGTTIQDVRFLANAEVVIYRLHHVDHEQ